MPTQGGIWWGRGAVLGMRCLFGPGRGSPFVAGHPTPDSSRARGDTSPFNTELLQRRRVAARVLRRQGPVVAIRSWRARRRTSVQAVRRAHHERKQYSVDPSRDFPHTHGPACVPCGERTGGDCAGAEALATDIRRRLLAGGGRSEVLALRRRGGGGELPHAVSGGVT